MNVYVLTLYDPAACFGYTEVFASVELAMRYAGVRGWKKRGDVYTWNDGETEVRVKEKYGLLSWKCDSSVFKIRKKRLRGTPRNRRAPSEVDRPRRSKPAVPRDPDLRDQRLRDARALRRVAR